MYETVRGMIENFFSVIDRYGFIPNGGREYYSKRSHPPLLSDMVKSYVSFTHDYDFAVSSIKHLEKEFQFFIDEKLVEVNGHKLYRYEEKSSGPRYRKF